MQEEIIGSSIHFRSTIVSFISPYQFIQSPLDAKDSIRIISQNM